VAFFQNLFSIVCRTIIEIYIFVGRSQGNVPKTREYAIVDGLDY